MGNRASVADAAKRVGVDPSSVRRWILAGELVAERREGERGRTVDLDAVDALVRRKSAEHAPLPVAPAAPPPPAVAPSIDIQQLADAVAARLSPPKPAKVARLRTTVFVSLDVARRWRIHAATRGEELSQVAERALVRLLDEEGA